MLTALINKRSKDSLYQVFGFHSDLILVLIKTQKNKNSKSAAPKI